MTSGGSLSVAIGYYLVLLCFIPQIKGDGLWGQWSDFSPCSRSCGGGIQSRTRGCQHMGSGKGMGCVGPDKEYMSCKTESCPQGSQDFRRSQCSKFDLIPMTLNGHSQRYTWVPYFDEKNRCALKCQADGTDSVRELEEMVVDGTECDAPETFGVCTGGVCQSVGCDRMMGSVMKEDKCRVCGGDGSACRTDSGVFNQQNLNVGYHDVVTIPAGSTTIRVTKKRPSYSYLGLKNNRGQFHINGGRDRTSQMALAGTIFQYYSADNPTNRSEAILSRGPTNEELIVVLIAREGNPGIEYEYSSPQGLVENADPTKRYTWVYGQWTSCSTDCGNGYQLRAVSCMDRQTGGSVNERNCDPMDRPRGNQTCNKGTCAEDRTNGYSWVLGHWDECSVLCGVGEQIQLAYCQEKGTMGQTIFVSDDLCLRYLGEKPVYKRACQGESGCPHWATGAWNECGVTCGLGYQTRRVYCRRLSEEEVSTTVRDSECVNQDKPEDSKPCDLSACPGTRTREDRIREVEGREETLVQCSETRHGCCHDGVTAALGSGYLGCPDRVTDQCSLDRSRGPCANYTLKWYYDDATNMCNMFWYGGCGGNDNRFETEEECDGKCSTKDGTGGGSCTPGSTRCRNIEKCIPDARVCDGFNDCGDNSDEENCIPTGSTTNQCGAGSSMCRSVKKCVSDTRKCDGYDDCGDNSDEENCDTNTSTDSQCSDGASMCRSIRKCVADRRRCDGYDDCGDNSDEENCGTDDNGHSHNQCGPGRSMCRSVRKCVHDSRRCDGRDDCSDNSDEENCETTDNTHSNPCGRGRSMCRSVRRCVQDSRRCDGNDDCGDNSDEENCEDKKPEPFPTNQCGSGSSMCRSIKKCVPDSRRCDGRDDCGDNSDEENCETTDNTHSNPCGRGRSMCRSVRRCVQDSRRCDGNDDCGDNSDEENCESKKPEPFPTNKCGPNRSMCRSVKKCVHDSRRCDGINDCGDNSDEENCESEKPEPPKKKNPCGAGAMLCRSVRKCVADWQKCDGNDDCGDNSDEEGCNTDNSHSNQCGRGRSMCRSVRRCVHDSRRCDGNDDCGDNSDEENCESKKPEPFPTNQCGSGRSMCRSVKKCVHDSRRCDGRNDCGDNSDEENCGTTDNGHTHNRCGSGSSMCRSVKKCVHDSRRCDGRDDCGDNSDEENCEPDIGHRNQCGTGSSMCRSVKKCVSDTRKCDGYDDCGDNSDEENCGSPSTSNRCGEGRSMCRSVKKCVSDSQRCDGRNDCGDNSDEENCADKLNSCGEGSSFCRSVKKCVADSRRCDGYDDCGDNSDEEGCEDISIECGTSTYGCCPDGQTSATGPDQDGCPTVVPATKSGAFDSASCSLPKEKGKCGDWKAQWHFSTTMGACSQFWYGGCGGNANRFENKTECEDACQHPKGTGMCRLPKAMGPCKANKQRFYYDYMSGECKKFTYGGCRGNNNRFRSKAECEMKCSDSTYIDSEDDDGPRGVSLCKTSTYGCCPDGKTSSLGPNHRGCENGCKTSAYGCCEDGITAAYGPGYYGCEVESGMEPCEMSEFGCCSDGTTSATGENQEGCDDQVVVISGGHGRVRTDEACHQDKDSTRCQDFVVQWYWDRQEQTCKRFWFGGCEGALNHFDSQEDCLGRCKNVVDVGHGHTGTVENKCHMPKEIGPCKALLTRWYFDRYNQQCRSFDYGGCHGNDNNFLSERECQQECGGRVATPAPPATRAPTLAPTTSAPLVKPEKSSITMQAEDYVKEGRNLRIKCDAITMSTASSRMMEWFKDGNVIDVNGSPRIDVMTDMNGHSMSSELTVQGAEKSDSGTYYCRTRPDGDVKMMTVTVVDVSHQMETTPPPTYPPNFYTTSAPMTRLTRPGEVCMLSMESGPCYASIPKWYYDYQEGVCKEFSYGGCSGNENNFNSKEECDTFCRPEEICMLPRETGRCRALIPRWWYNSVSSSCQEFNYGGCGGTPNNFASKDSCERRCMSRNTIDTSSTTDVCSLPRAGGNCEGYNILWYYDTDISRCRRFIYTGCEGNGNRFESEEECESACDEDKRRGGGGVIVQQTTTSAPVPDTKSLCDLRPDNARCDGNNDPSNYQIKWYYDYERSLCTRFYYGGCGGNDNRFETRQECQSQCVYARKVVTTPAPRPLTTPRPLNCKDTPHGCCQDDVTTAVDEYHSNCDDGPNVIEQRRGEGYEVYVRPGRDVLIQCRIRHSDRDLISWFRDRFTVKTGHRHVLYNNGSLLIKAMKPEDAGTYSCQVSGGNNVPQVMNYNVQVRVPLRILSSPKMIKIRPGENAFLHCQVYGQPTPTVTWFKNGRPVSSTGHYRAFENGTLIIMHAQDRDTGDYECHAENSVSPMVKKTVQLHIRERVRAKLDPYKGKVVEGGTIRLRCTGNGYPRPTMHWERDGKQLETVNKTSVNGRELVIRDAAIEDSGIYTCVVKNKHHEARAVTVVQVVMQKMTDNCEDSMPKMKCKMIRTARLCGHRMFAKMCCKTCTGYRYR